MEESMRVEEEGSSSLVEKYMRYEMAKEMERLNKTSIYRVPAHIKNMKGERAYRPQLVSLGPFHYGQQDLWPMEGHKLRALLHLVKRTTNVMGVFVAAVKGVADQLEAAYGQDLDDGWRGDNNRKRFVDMMVTDGCFLLEAMRMIELKGEVPADYASNDPVFSKHGYLYLKNVILADMFVMENQLPMLLLETLASNAIFSDSIVEINYVGDMIKNMVVAFYGLPFDSRYLGESERYLDSDSHPINIARYMLCGESERYEDTMPSFLKRYIDIARKMPSFLKRNMPSFLKRCIDIARKMPSFLKRCIDIARKMLSFLERNMPSFLKRYIDIAREILCGGSERCVDESREREDTMPSFLKRYIDIARKILCGGSERCVDESREREDTMPSFLKRYIDIARKILCGGSERYPDEWRQRKDTMPSALELYVAGIHFKASRSRSLLDIDFQRGVLSMPVLRVHNDVRTVFLNLMAFEQLHPGAGNGVTEYLIFMDHIIDSAKDVALLRSKGVLDCALGSDKEVAELFNTLSKGAVMDPSMKRLQDVRLRVNAYCRKPLNKWRASFLHTYFRNPWVFISLVAAAVLLVATLVQTIFTIKPLR